MDTILFFTVLLWGFVLLIGSLRLGYEYILALFAGLGVAMAFMITHPVNVFGWPVVPAEALYASFFLGTDIVTEQFGKKRAKKLLYVMLGGFVGVILFAKLVIALNPSNDLAKGFAIFFTPLSTWSLIVASIAVFVVQRFDIFLFSKIKEKTGGIHLWLRNCASTIGAQSLDVLVVYPIFFFPILGLDTWKVMLASAVIKLIMVILDTPLIYLARKLAKK